MRLIIQCARRGQPDCRLKHAGAGLVVAMKIIAARARITWARGRFFDKTGSKRVFDAMWQPAHSRQKQNVALPRAPGRWSVPETTSPSGNIAGRAHPPAPYVRGQSALRINELEALRELIQRLLSLRLQNQGHPCVSIRSSYPASSLLQSPPISCCPVS